MSRISTQQNIWRMDNVAESVMFSVFELKANVMFVVS